MSKQTVFALKKGSRKDAQKSKQLGWFRFFLWWWLNRQGLKLAVHYDLRNIAHLAVLRHNPILIKQYGFFLDAGKPVYDDYFPVPGAAVELFTIINTEDLWSGVTIHRNRFGFDLGLFKKIRKAVFRLKSYECLEEATDYGNR
ncbi:hypothetical protein MUP46_03285 [Patescibacteria group bacterium]|nr:hypothetical protein [Patescibacteria group bacterium]